MTYRDDLEAAQARAEAAERRAAELEKRLGDQRSDEPLVPVPQTFEVTSTVPELTVRWRSGDGGITEVMGSVGLLIIGIVIAVVGTAVGIATGLILAFCGVVATYSTLCDALNRITLSIAGDELRVRRGPIPELGNDTLQIADIKQLFVRERKRDKDGVISYEYDLYVIDDKDRENWLVATKAKTEAQYLEHVMEQRLRIKDRPVAGEVPK